MAPRVRWLLPALVATTIIVFVVAPSARPPTVVALGTVAAVTVAGVAYRRRFPRWPAWWLIAAGIVIIAMAEAAFDAAAIGGRADQYPSAADVLQLCAYPLLGAGIMWVGMPRSANRDWAAIIEIAALSLAGSLVGWIFLIRPTVNSLELSGAGKLVAVGVWVGDVIVMVAAVRLTVAWRTNSAAIVLGAGAVALFLSDLRYGVDLLHGVWHSGGQVDAGLFVFYLAAVISVLLPAAPGVGGGRATGPRFGVTGLASLTVALLAGPTVLLAEASPGPVATPVAIGIVSAGIGLLVSGRLGMALRDQRRAATRDTIGRAAVRRLVQAATPHAVTDALTTAVVRTTRDPAAFVTLTPGLPNMGEASPSLESRLGSRRLVVLRVPISGTHHATADGDGHGDAVRAEWWVEYHGALNPVLEVQDRLVALADMAGVALHRIDLAARVDTARRQQDVLAYRASHDPLTGLANADLFRETLHTAGQTLAPGRVTAVLCIDLDNFKTINDSLGHETGDRVLIEAAARIRGRLREADLAARLGGDEFAVLLRNQTPVAAETVAGHLTAILGAPTTIDTATIAMAASIGLAVASTRAGHDQLLRRADTALYAAKAAGKGGWRGYTADMPDPLERASDVSTQLRYALHVTGPDEAGLTLHYQPIIDLAVGGIAGFEALMRFEHPRLGSISTTEIISVAERTGMIEALGAWVLDTALADAPQLISGGRYVAINVSVAQLRLAGFIDQLRDRIQAAGVDPAHVVIEVTESQLIDDHDQIWLDLDRLRRTGVRVAIDDYGTGYATLAYLQQPAIDMVKLDQRYAQALPDARTRRLVRAVLDLTNDLELPVVAEGIETEAARDILAALGCRYGQGHLFAAAMPVATAASWQPPAPSRSGGLTTRRS